MEEHEARPPLAGLITLFIGAAFITVGVCFLTYGLYQLIRTGVWPHYPFSKMLAEIGMPLPQGGEGPIAWIASQSACVVLLSIGTVIAALGAWLIARFNRKRRLAAAEAETAAA
jgi:hypothetical protein